MKYHDGQEIFVNDRVDLGGGMTGVVVCDFDNEIYHKEFPGDYWGEFEVGVMVKSKEAGLVHFSVLDTHLSLVERE